MLEISSRYVGTPSHLPSTYILGVLTLRDFYVLANSCKVNIALSESGLKLPQDSLNTDFWIAIPHF